MSETNYKELFFKYYNSYYNKSNIPNHEVYDLFDLDTNNIRFFNKISQRTLNACIRKNYSSYSSYSVNHEIFKYIPQVLDKLTCEKVEYFQRNVHDLRFYKYFYIESFDNKSLNYNKFLNIYKNYYSSVDNLIFDIIEQKCSDIKKHFPLLYGCIDKEYINFSKINHFLINTDKIVLDFINNPSEENRKRLCIYNLFNYIDQEKLNEQQIKNVLKYSPYNIQYIKDDNLIKKFINEQYITDDYLISKVLIRKKIIDIDSKFLTSDVLKNLDISNIDIRSISQSLLEKIILSKKSLDILLKALDYNFKFSNDFILEILNKKLSDSSFTGCIKKVNKILKYKFYDSNFIKYFIDDIVSKNISFYKSLPLTTKYMNYFIDNYIDKIETKNEYILREYIYFVTDKDRQFKLINKDVNFYQTILNPDNDVTYEACKRNIENFRYIKPELLDEKTLIKLKMTEFK